MKAKFIKHILVKADEGKYFLFKEDETGFRLQVCNKLSKQNCDEIFGVTDVEKLAKIHHKLQYIDAYNPDIEPYVVADYTAGFNKAMELMKDKLTWFKQPTEIEVEIEMDTINDGLDEMAQPQYAKVPKLDSEGCLKLKKIED
jgi:hypothetical protein